MLAAERSRASCEAAQTGWVPQEEVIILHPAINESPLM